MYGNPILGTFPSRRCLLTPGLRRPFSSSRVEELQSLEAATGWAATTEPTVVLMGGRAGEDDLARSLFGTVTKLTGR
jgi:hypothetical protein